MHARGWALVGAAWVALASGCGEGSPATSPLRVAPGRVVLSGRVGEALRATVQLENTGDVAAQIVRAEVGAALAGEVRLVGVPERVPGRAIRTFDVVMVPAAPGVRRDGVRLELAEGAPATVQISADVRGPLLEVFPSRLELGAVALGDARGADLTLHLIGGEALELATATVRGAPGYLVEAGLPRRLVPGGRATVRVTFAPTVVGDAPAELVLGAGAEGLPPIALHALAIEADVVLEPARVELGEVLVGERRAHRLRVVSRARAPHRLSLSASGATAAFEGLAALSATVTVEAGGALEHEIALAPRAVGTASITVWGRIDGGARRPLGGVVGEGVADPARALRLDPPEIALGKLEVGHAAVSSVWLVNDAVVPVTATGTAAITPGVPAAIAAAAPLPSPMPARDRHRFFLRITPDRVGPVLGELTLFGARAQIRYEGVARPVANLAAPGDVDLGVLLEGPGLAARTVALERTGRLEATPTATVTGAGARWLRVTSARTTSTAIEVDLRGIPAGAPALLRARLQVALPDGAVDVPLVARADGRPADMFALCVVGTGAELHLVPRGGAPWDAPGAASACAPGGAGGVWAIGRADPARVCAAADRRFSLDPVLAVVTTPRGAPATLVQFTVGDAVVSSRWLSGGRGWNVAWVGGGSLSLADDPGWDAGPARCR